MPDAPLPINRTYPGGELRSKWHLDKGAEIFERLFGFRPAGLWPSEGGVSQEALALFADSGFTWLASGGSVLDNSHDAQHKSCSHRLYRFGDADIHCAFRDDGLSDLIGFTYSDWHAKDAVANLVGHMEHIATLCPDRDNCLINVILDGENAWEYYPDNAFHFIGRLYERLVQCEEIEITTFDEALGSCPTVDLPKLCPGSWVYGSFSTWIGEADKNRAWDRLVEAKIAYDGAMAEGRLDAQQAQQAGLQLAICEGSDWFWWFGDYNPSDSVRDFDELYRQQLKNLYEILGKPVPGNLDEPLSQGGGAAENAGTMRRGRD